MTRPYILLFLLFFLLVISCRKSQSESSTYKEIKHEFVSSDLSSMHVTSFMEDTHGYMWIGTTWGLNKYNGYDYHHYFSDYDDSLTINDDYINVLFTDSKQNLWVGTSNGISKYNVEKDCFQRIPKESRGKNNLQIFENREGRIFANMSINLCEYDTISASFKTVLNFDYEAYINTCHIDENNRLWVVSPLYVRCYDKDFNLVYSLKPAVEGANTYYSYLHENGDLWVFFDNSLYIIDTHKGVYKSTPASLLNHPVLSQSAISDIFPYKKGIVVISTKTNGLFLYDLDKNTLMEQEQKDFPIDAPKYQISAMYIDSHQNIWLGPIDQGFVVNYKYKQQFNINNILRNKTDGKSITSLAVDHMDNLWIASPHTNELLVYNIKTEELKTINQKELALKAGLNDKIDYIYIDSGNHIWLCIRNRLLKCLYKNGNIGIRNVLTFPAIISSVAEDSEGTIWVGGFSEYVYALPANKDKFSNMRLYPKDYHFVSDILILKSNKIIFNSFRNDLKVLDPITSKLTDIRIKDRLKNPKYIPTALLEDKENNLWIGTRTNGLLYYSFKNDSIVNYSHPMSCNDITSIIEDQDENIWVSTLYGLNKINKKTNEVLSYYSYDGIGGNQFNRKSACLLSDSTLVFGGKHGLTVFNPKKIKPKKKNPLYFEDLYIQGKLEKVGESKAISQNLIFAPQVNLGYDQRNISISYAVIDFNEYPQTRYYYKMEGYDKKWIEARYSRQANYSNLPPGEYTFRVRITTNDSNQILTENAMPINVAQTFWLSWPIILLYITFALALIVYINHLYLRVKINKSKALMALQEKEYEKNVNKMNMHFFSNISHEFRTPLTMIAGPISTLCKDSDMKPENSYLLSMVNRSVNRMLKLVNQLMDFNKLENDSLKLRVHRSDIIHHAKKTLELFIVNAKSKGINFQVKGFDSSIIMLLDKDMLDKILENLLSNAMKHSTEGDCIDVEVEIIDKEKACMQYPLTEKDISLQYVKISVGDEGAGIPHDKYEKIFERYYQLEEDKSANKLGTGIGLYYAKRLTELHHGYIKVKNKSSKGCIFSFILPLSSNMYSQQEFEYLSQDDELTTDKKSEETIKFPDRIKADDGRYSILVVEDDTEISQYINLLLSPFYKVVNKFDALAALESLDEFAPDLILSDILMPGIDGYQFCKKIKENILYCHIPVVLLTAKSMVEEQVHGFDVGANAYISKPFEPAYLLALIKSQLKNRNYIQNLVSNRTEADEINNEMLTVQDRVFLSKLYALVEQELSNPELNISKMTEILGMSRSKLYYKIKGLTGENPNVFFRSYKLNRAAQLLKEGQYNISEIADLTGFSTPSHFSASFKKQFNCSPSEYKG